MNFTKQKEKEMAGVCECETKIKEA